MSEMALRAAAWLLTYALHSTLLLSAALLIARRVRGEAWRETLWKAALVGGLLTATLQTQSGYDPPFGTWRIASVVEIQAELPADPPAAPADAAQTAIEPVQTAAQLASAGSTALAAGTEAANLSTPAPVESPAHVESTASFSIRPLIDLAVAVWMVIAALLIVRIAWRQTRLWKMLRGRHTVTAAAVLGMMEALRRNAGLWRPVRLTACAAIPTPLALGGGEICVPPRFLADLDPEQQRSALAHELAHLARRDPAWHFAVGVIEAVFFFQPLNRLARLRLRESAEFLCDEWAARQTGSPLGLARCLAEVASWVAPGRAPIPAGTMAMAEGGSPLVQRVQRLTAWRGGGNPASGAMRAAGGLLLVLAVAVAAPAVASSGERRAEPATDEQGEKPKPAVNAQDNIIRHPRPSEPLASRWTWAVEEIGRRRMERAWIVYSVPALLKPGHTWVMDSGSFGIGELGRAAVNSVVGAPEEDMVMIFRVTLDGTVERVAGRGAAGFEFGRTPVLWLGRSQGGESYAQLRRLADGMRDASVRESLVEAVGMHRGDQMVPYLAAVLGRDRSSGVRREAAQALGRHPGDEALTALRTAVDRDGSDDVRREAVEAIGAMNHPQSAIVLRELVGTSVRAEVRRTAMEAMSETGAITLESLREVALTSTDPGVAREAVESMEAFPPRDAVRALRQVAWSGSGAAARQAVESLRQFPSPYTLVALDSIARAHPDTDVAVQAVESLGTYREPIIDTYLSVIAARTRGTRVEQEARDEIRRRLGARPASGDDTNRKPDAENEATPDF